MGSYYTRIATAYGSIVREIAVITLTLRARGSAIAAVTYANVGESNATTRDRHNTRSKVMG